MQRGSREVAILVVDRLDPRPIHGQQLASVEVEPPAKQYELTEYRPEGRPIVAPKVGDGLEVRLQASEQPDHLDVAVALHLQPTARPHPVQIAVDVELQQIGRGVAGAARRLRLDPDEPRRPKVQLIDKGVDESHRIVRADIVVHRLRQQQHLRAMVTRNVRHAGVYRAKRGRGIRTVRLSTQSA